MILNCVANEILEMHVCSEFLILNQNCVANIYTKDETM
jgi:hypothetical protein